MKKNNAHIDQALRHSGSYDPSDELRAAQKWLTEKCRTLSTVSRLNPDKRLRLFDLATDWRTILTSWDPWGNAVTDAGAESVRRAMDLSIEIRAGRYRPAPLFERPAPDSEDPRLIVAAKPIDQVVQRAVAKVLTAVFEPRAADCSYAYRKRRGTRAAVQAIANFVVKVQAGHVVRIDVAKFYPSVQRRRLTRVLRKHVRDTKFIALVHLLLGASVRRIDGTRTPSRGLPQGGALAPLLANMYMDEFDRAASARLDGDILLVRYSDDILLVVPGDRPRAERVLKDVQQALADSVGLTVNESKTTITPFDEPFDFVGVRFSVTQASTRSATCQLDVSEKSQNKLITRLMATPRQDQETCASYTSRLEEKVRAWLSGRAIAPATRVELQALIEELVRCRVNQAQTFMTATKAEHDQEWAEIETKWAVTTPSLPNWRTDPIQFSELLAFWHASVEYLGSGVSRVRGALEQALNSRKLIALPIEGPLRAARASRADREAALREHDDWRELSSVIHRLELELIVVESRFDEAVRQRAFLSRYRSMRLLERATDARPGSGAWS